MRAMMKIWVSGASGQVGTAITDVADPLAFELLNTDVEELDITEIDEVLNFAELNRPDVIIQTNSDVFPVVGDRFTAEQVQHSFQIGESVSLLSGDKMKSMVTPVFATLIFD